MCKPVIPLMVRSRDLGTYFLQIKVDQNWPTPEEWLDEVRSSVYSIVDTETTSEVLGEDPNSDFDSAVMN